MRKRWVWDNEKEELVPQKERNPARLHYVMGDVKDYHSPSTLDEKGNFKLISGRAQRREDLKRSGCREVDPSEKQDFFNYRDEPVYEEAPYVRDTVYLD